MAERLSTGFVNAKNTVGSTKDIMDGGVIHIFGGATQPASADDAEQGDLLLKLTKDGLVHTPGSATNGIVLGTSVDGVLSGNGDTITGVGEAIASTGTTATWFRWYDKDVVTGASSSAIRIDGQVGNSAAFELFMSNPVIVQDFPATINTLTYTSKKS